jgi:hypothetical protein
MEYAPHTPRSLRLLKNLVRQVPVRRYPRIISGFEADLRSIHLDTPGTVAIFLPARYAACRPSEGLQSQVHAGSAGLRSQLACETHAGHSDKKK